MKNLEQYNNLIEEAYQRTEPVNYRFFMSNGDMLKNTSAAAFLILDEKRYGIRSENTHSRNINNLRSLILPGQEPVFDVGPIWCKTLTSIMVAVAKETPTIWNEFTAEEKSKFDLIMKMYAVIGYLGTDDENNFDTNFTTKVRYNKGWGPNIRLSNIPPIFFAAKYFDEINTHYLDTWFDNFDGDNLISELQSANFTKAIAMLNTPIYDENGNPNGTIKDIMENGGEIYYKTMMFGFENLIYGGSGQGIHGQYNFHGRDLRMPLAAFGKLGDFVYIHNNYETGEAEICPQRPRLKNNRDLTDTTTYGLGRNLDSNELYMYAELDSVDEMGFRTSLWHSATDFILFTFIIDAVNVLNLAAQQDEEAVTAQDLTLRTIRMDIIQIINRDLIYKVNHDYVGFSLGHPEIVSRATIEKLGYNYAESIWTEFYAENAE